MPAPWTGEQLPLLQTRAELVAFIERSEQAVGVSRLDWSVHRAYTGRACSLRYISGRPATVLVEDANGRPADLTGPLVANLASEAGTRGLVNVPSQVRAKGPVTVHGVLTVPPIYLLALKQRGAGLHLSDSDAALDWMLGAPDARLRELAVRFSPYQVEGLRSSSTFRLLEHLGFQSDAFGGLHDAELVLWALDLAADGRELDTAKDSWVAPSDGAYLVPDLRAHQQHGARIMEPSELLA